MGHYIPLEKVAQIRQLDAEGKSLREIARLVGVKPNTVMRYRNKHAAVVDREREEFPRRPRGPYRKQTR